MIDRHFAGHGSDSLAVLVSSPRYTAGDAPFRRAVERSARVLAREAAVADVAPAAPWRLHLSGRAGGAWCGAGPARTRPRWSARRTACTTGFDGLAPPGVELAITGSPALWSQFNEANKAAMLRSEIMSWPLTLAVLVVAFGSLAAAGIPLLLSIAGLVATAGALWLGTRLTGITIWAMNFALMFALAVGIDYGLFVVVRFRAALRAGLRPLDAVGETMDSAGKAVLVSGLAVLASLSAVMVVPSQPFRTSALGIMLAVGFVLAASLTLLPAVLARLGPRIDSFALPWAGAVQHRSEAFARWGRLIWRRPVLLGGACGPVAGLARATGARPAHGDAHHGSAPADAGARVGHERTAASVRLGCAGRAAGRGTVARGPPRRGGCFAQCRDRGRARRRAAPASWHW